MLAAAGQVSKPDIQTPRDSERDSSWGSEHLVKVEATGGNAHYLDGARHAPVLRTVVVRRSWDSLCIQICGEIIVR
jgi:hypothetical protein